MQIFTLTCPHTAIDLLLNASRTKDGAILLAAESKTTTLPTLTPSKAGGTFGSVLAFMFSPLTGGGPKHTAPTSAEKARDANIFYAIVADIPSRHNLIAMKAEVVAEVETDCRVQQTDMMVDGVHRRCWRVLGAKSYFFAD